ncbi:MAG: DsrE family protein [Campylobacterales bacterium]|nr:DsrE family protein [Campylobacterales bacterium]
MRNVFLLFIILVETLEAKEYKAVFDCSSGDSAYIKSRMWLLDKTISMIESKGDKATFAITLHGKCVAMTSEHYEMIVPDEDIQNIKVAQEYLQSLISERGVKVTVCAMSLNNNAILQEDVIEKISISPNSFLDTISYQNDGYALMTFK